MRTKAGSRTYGYGRVSTAEHSAENQRLELTEAGYDVTGRRWFADSISAKVPAMQRPEFTRLSERLEAGDTLGVAKLDRLGRDSMDVEHTLRDMEEADLFSAQRKRRDGTRGGTKPNCLPCSPLLAVVPIAEWFFAVVDCRGRSGGEVLVEAAFGCFLDSPAYRVPANHPKDRMNPGSPW